MYDIAQNQAFALSFFLYDNNGDPVLNKIDANFNKTIKKSGQAFAAMTVTITEAGFGWYDLTLSASHTDTLGQLIVVLNAAGAKQVNLLWRVFNKTNNEIVPIGGPVVLTSSGLDGVLVEVGISGGLSFVTDTGTELTQINARQALALVSAICAGVTSGAGTTGFVIHPLGKPGDSPRAVAAVDGIGNRVDMNIRVPD